MSMKSFILSSALSASLVLPFAAHADERLTGEQLLNNKAVIVLCGGSGVESARYLDDTSNQVEVVCARTGAGFSPLDGGLGEAGGIALISALALIAAASGSGSSTSDTQ